MVHTSENEYRMFRQLYLRLQSYNLRSNHRIPPAPHRNRHGGMPLPPGHDPDHTVSRKAASPHFSNSSCPGILIQETFW